MLRKLLAIATLAGACLPAAQAAPIGWYDLGLSWRDGGFAGRIFYDDSSPFQVLQVKGILTTGAQSSAIKDVWNVSNGVPVDADFPLAFTNRADGAGALDYNAAFYLELADLGSTLGVVNTPGSAYGLYDWSNPALFDEEHLNNSPLLSWQLSALPSPVPEPGMLATLAAGLAACALSRRRA